MKKSSGLFLPDYRHITGKILLDQESRSLRRRVQNARRMVDNNEPARFIEIHREKERQARIRFEKKREEDRAKRQILLQRVQSQDTVSERRKNPFDWRLHPTYLTRKSGLHSPDPTLSPQAIHSYAIDLSSIPFPRLHHAIHSSRIQRPQSASSRTAPMAEPSGSLSDRPMSAMEPSRVPRPWDSPRLPDSEWTPLKDEGICSSHESSPDFLCETMAPLRQRVDPFDPGLSPREMASLLVASIVEDATFCPGDAVADILDEDTLQTFSLEENVVSRDQRFPEWTQDSTTSPTSLSAAFSQNSSSFGDKISHRVAKPPSRPSSDFNSLSSSALRKRRLGTTRQSSEATNLSSLCSEDMSSLMLPSPPERPQSGKGRVRSSPASAKFRTTAQSSSSTKNNSACKSTRRKTSSRSGDRVHTSRSRKLPHRPSWDDSTTVSKEMVVTPGAVSAATRREHARWRAELDALVGSYPDMSISHLIQFLDDPDFVDTKFEEMHQSSILESAFASTNDALESEMQVESSADVVGPENSDTNGQVLEGGNLLGWSNEEHNSSDRCDSSLLQENKYLDASHPSSYISSSLPASVSYLPRSDQRQAIRTSPESVEAQYRREESLRSEILAQHRSALLRKLHVQEVAIRDARARGLFMTTSVSGRDFHLDRLPSLNPALSSTRSSVRSIIGFNDLATKSHEKSSHLDDRRRRSNKVGPRSPKDLSS